MVAKLLKKVDMIWLGLKMSLELDQHLIAATEYEEKNASKYKTKTKIASGLSENKIKNE